MIETRRRFGMDGDAYLRGYAAYDREKKDVVVGVAGVIRW